MKRYNFNGTVNARDLGGYPAGNGQYTKYGVFIRSDGPTNLDTQDLQCLLDMGIGTIIDLRNPDTAASVPNSFTGREGFNCVNYPMAEKVTRIAATEPEFVQMYFQMAQNREVMGGILRTIAAAEGGVLYHCQEGKDRTGIVSALLLSLAGTPQNDICADYSVSGIYLRDRAKEQLSILKDLPPFFFTSKVDYIEGFLALLAGEYGSVRAYLRFLGLSNREMKRIKKKLVDEKQI